jgi:chaperonin GroES
MKTQIQPLGENILVMPVAAQEQTTAGIFLPDTASKEKPQQGKVVAVGTDEDILVKKGQNIIYSRYAGTEVTMDGVEYLIVKKEDVLAVIA